VLVAGLAKMHLGVDDARQNVQSARVKTLRPTFFRNGSNRGDPSCEDPDVRLAGTIRTCDGAAADDEVEHLSGRLRWCYGACTRTLAQSFA